MSQIYSLKDQLIDRPAEKLSICTEFIRKTIFMKSNRNLKMEWNITNILEIKVKST